MKLKVQGVSNEVVWKPHLWNRQTLTKQSWITPKTKTKLKLYYTMQTIILYINNLWYNDGVNNLNWLYENSI